MFGEKFTYSKTSQKHFLSEIFELWKAQKNFCNIGNWNMWQEFEKCILQLRKNGSLTVHYNEDFNKLHWWIVNNEKEWLWKEEVVADNIVTFIWRDWSKHKKSG